MDIKEFLKNNEANMLEDLATLVKYNSVNSDDELPFGSENKKVLDEAIRMMNGIGLNTTNLDYYCGYGEMGEGDKTIGVLAHLDIVPAGDGWNTNPFELTRDGDMLYGRGVTDDKGPFIASLYALKYLKESGYKLNKKLRLIAGCNEETGSNCIKHYVSKEGHIDLGFTPDGSFPGIYAEKGMVGATIKSLSRIKFIKGGEASNVVCKKVVCTLPRNTYDESELNEFFRDNDITYHMIKDDTTITLTVFGKAAHASLPELGVNALSYLMEGLYVAGFDDELVAYYHDKIGLTSDGSIIGADKFNDDESAFTMNVGGVCYKENSEICLSVDIRYPVTANNDEMVEFLNKNMNLGNNHFVVNSTHEPLYFKQDTPMVKALLNAYINVTGKKDAKMECIGGGTYAKAMNNCIAFGCEENDFDNHIHDANENARVSDLLRQVEIYVEAIKNLNEV